MRIEALGYVGCGVKELERRISYLKSVVSDEDEQEMQSLSDMVKAVDALKRSVDRYKNSKAYQEEQKERYAFGSIDKVKHEFGGGYGQ